MRNQRREAPFSRAPLQSLDISQININKIMEEEQFVNLWRKEVPKVFRNGLGTCNKKFQLQLVDSKLLSEIFYRRKR